MEDKLVTLAIHTFEKAQILKTMLETEGIEAVSYTQLSWDVCPGRQHQFCASCTSKRDR